MPKRRKTKKRISKKNKKLFWKFTIPILVILSLAVLIFLAFKFVPVFQMQLPTGIDVEHFDTMTQGPCILTFDKNRYCEGETIIGTLVDGKNANCAVAENFNFMGWVLIGVVTTDANGRHTETPTAGVAGFYTYAVICVDENNVVCRTNDVDITVVDCGPDSDGDGFSDEEEEEAGTDPFDPNDYPGSGVTYTCGILSDIYCSGTCPPTYPYCLEVATDPDNPYKWACVCTNYEQEIHPDWKHGGSNFYEHDDTPPPEPECYTDSDCVTNYFCFEGNCEPRCEDRFGTIRTNYLGAWYSACWDGCGYDRDCCATTYFYYDGSYSNGEQWFYHACEWVEGQRCSNFNGCVPPGGNHP